MDDEDEEDRPPHHKWSWRYEPVITLGNFLAILPPIVLIVAWSVHQEARIDHEQDLRARLEVSVTGDLGEMKRQQVANVQAIELHITDEAQRARDRSSEIMQGLRRLDDKLTALMMVRGDQTRKP